MKVTLTHSALDGEHFVSADSFGVTRGRAIAHRGLCRLRSLLVACLSVLAEASLGFGTWHVLLAMGEGGFVAMRNIRQAATSRCIEDANP
nr:hypothetical protein [Dyella sp. ASV24]